MPRTLRLADGRRRPAERDQLAEALVADLPDTVLAYGKSRLPAEGRAAELHRIDDLGLVRSLERHRGDGRAHILRERVVREARDHLPELLAVLEEPNLAGDVGLAREEAFPVVRDRLLREGWGRACLGRCRRLLARAAARSERQCRDQ